MYINNRNLAKIQWLSFLKMSKKTELISNYVLDRKEASSFLQYVDILIRSAKTNGVLFHVFSFLLHFRTFVAAYKQLSFFAFLSCTVPSAISFYVATTICYAATNCFFIIYVLTCIFIRKSLKSATKFRHIISLDSNKVFYLARINLKGNY